MLGAGPQNGNRTGGYKTVTDLVLIGSIVMWSSGDDDPTVQ